jgi:hypothetical protein
LNKKIRKTGHKPAKKAAAKARKPMKVTSPQKPRVAKPKPIGPTQRSPVESVAIPKEPLLATSRIEIAIDRIEGETILGDLMVVFPRTRDVLKRHGLNLDVEEAGDIYMSLEAFAALKGLKAETLVEELETASKELPPQPAPAVVTPVP